MLFNTTFNIISIISPGLRLWSVLPKDIPMRNLVYLVGLEPGTSKKPFENTVGKGENAGKQNFSFSLQCFAPIKKGICFQVTFILLSANAFNLEHSKNKSFGKELKQFTFQLKISFPSTPKTETTNRYTYILLCMQYIQGKEQSKTPKVTS